MPHIELHRMHDYVFSIESRVMSHVTCLYESRVMRHVVHRNT